MERNIIFFDLDGTLTDPMLGITRSVQHALKAYGVIEEDLTRLIPFIGPPLKDSFMKFYDFSEEQAKEAIYKYREYFAAGEVAFIMQLGALLEELTVARARAGIEKLVHLTPQTARVLPDRF